MCGVRDFLSASLIPLGFIDLSLRAHKDWQTNLWSKQIAVDLSDASLRLTGAGKWRRDSQATAEWEKEKEQETEKKKRKREREQEQETDTEIEVETKAAAQTQCELDAPIQIHR